MRRGVALYFVGSVCLLALAGCGRSWLAFEEREPWRREAEVACLKAGTLKQSAAITPIKAIDGPGICGADYPLKVAALGESSALGYAEDLRPPAAVPRGFPIPEPVRTAPMPMRSAEPPLSSGPMSIRPPGTDPDEDEEPDAPSADPYAVPGGRPPARSPYARPAQSYPAAPQFRADPDPAPPAPPGPSREQTLAASAASLVPAATLACPMVSALDSWMASAVQPAAQRWFGQPVVEIKQISAYSCRGMNGQRGAPISEHAFGNALDIAAFTLADSRRVNVKDGWRGEPEEQGFLRDIQGAACQNFSTVLAPGSNRFHYDHIHVDLARRRSGRSVCNPAAV